MCIYVSPLQTNNYERHAVLSHCKMKQMARYLKLHKTNTGRVTHILSTNYLTEWDATIDELRVETNTIFLMNEHVT